MIPQSIRQPTVLGVSILCELFLCNHALVEEPDRQTDVKIGHFVTLIENRIQIPCPHHLFLVVNDYKINVISMKQRWIQKRVTQGVIPLPCHQLENEPPPLC